MYSKYERRTDTRTYEDRRKLYEGGWEVVRAEHLQALWKEKYDEWLKRPKSKYLELLKNPLYNVWNSYNYLLITAKLPKWFGERPGKKSGDPDSPDEDEEGGAEAAPVDDYAEEEEEEEEEEVNFIFKTKQNILSQLFISISFQLFQGRGKFHFENKQTNSN